MYNVVMITKKGNEMKNTKLFIGCLALSAALVLTGALIVEAMTNHTDVFIVGVVLGMVGALLSPKVQMVRLAPSHMMRRFDESGMLFGPTNMVKVGANKDGGGGTIIHEVQHNWDGERI